MRSFRHGVEAFALSLVTYLNTISNLVICKRMHQHRPDPHISIQMLTNNHIHIITGVHSYERYENYNCGSDGRSRLDMHMDLLPAEVGCGASDTASALSPVLIEL